MKKTAHLKHLAFLISILVSFWVFSEPIPAWAQESLQETGLIDRMALLVIQIGIILFAAWGGGELFRRLNLPEVLGEVLAGTAIGPYLLGSFPFPGFSQGLFPLSGQFPVSLELYSLASIASIILLFFVGIETDIETFFKFSLSGIVVGVGGVIISFILGDLTGVLFSRVLFGVPYHFFDFVPMFLGVVATATSVGITARILSEKKKMDTPEGITILSGAVVDDVLGIITLAIVIGIIKHGNISWQEISLISIKAVSLWLGFTIAGLIFSRQLGIFVKKFKDNRAIAVMSLALAFLLAGIFEKSGLAMIIGAYVMGLAFAKTDLAFIILDNMSIMRRFFIPIFFCVMGMLVNLKEVFASTNILLVGLVFTVLAILGKILGCSIPALFFNFNVLGALRVGIGMIPRGEVALIIAGIGLSSGAIPHEAFSISMIMIFLTTLFTPPLLSAIFDSDKTGLRKEYDTHPERRHEIYTMPNVETAELVLNKILGVFESEGFYVHHLGVEEKLFNIRKDASFIIMKYTTQEITFDCSSEDLPLVHTLVYEVLAELERVIKNLKVIGERASIGRKIFETEVSKQEKNGLKITQYIHPSSVKYHLKADNKVQIIEELVELLILSGQLNQSLRQEVLQDIFARESNMSTGMQDGIALPHTKTDSVTKIICAVGLKKEGVDFDSLDQKPATIFVLTLAPTQSAEPYLQFMAAISKFLAVEKNRQQLLRCRSNYDMYNTLSQNV